MYRLLKGTNTILDTSLNTQVLYKGLQTARNNLSELPSQTNISKNQTQKNNVYFMGSSESLAFASNFKAGLNLNNKLIAFRGTDDEDEIIPNTNTTKSTPSAKQTAMALLLLASQILSPTTGNTQQNDTRQLNAALYSCSNQALHNSLEEDKPADYIEQEMNRICPEAMNQYNNLPPDQQQIINENVTAHVNANIEQLNAQAMEQQPDYTTIPGYTQQNNSGAITTDFNNCSDNAFYNVVKNNQPINSMRKEMDKICPETMNQFDNLPQEQQDIISTIAADRTNSMIREYNAQITGQTQAAPRTQQNPQLTEQPQTTGRMAQLPPNYRPVIPIDSPNIYLPHKLSDINLKMRKSANTCKDQETQEQCNQRALNTNLQLDSMQIGNRQMDEKSREINESYHSGEIKRLEEKEDRARENHERVLRENQESRIRRLTR